MSYVEALTRTFDGLASRIDASGRRSVGFTSALRGEGVSTVALGTAMSIAALRREAVLLIDANWVQPTLTSDAHLESRLGLADCLAKRARLDDVVCAGSRSRVVFLPIGDRGNARPALRSLSSFLVEDTSAFQSVIVDLPPIMAAESYVLPWARLLDDVVVVLRELATPVPVVRQALSRLPSASPSVVLNRAGTPAFERPMSVAAAHA